MTQSRRISCLVVLVVAPILLATRAAAQTYVTPTPPGQLIVVNNGPGEQTDPHVSGDTLLRIAKRLKLTKGCCKTL